MAGSTSSGGTPPEKKSAVYITVDLSPSADAARDMPAKAPGQAVAHTSTSPSGLWEPPDAKDLNRVLPGYEVIKLIGSGGMGAVYRARQKSLERHVALKILSPELAAKAPEFTERFNNEAGALAKLSHPSIVHLFDCGRTKDCQLYIAMELVDGRDVAERLAGKVPLPADEALSIALTVCEALEHAHRRGVIHRDIKPANVMLDAQGRVKITDFGLARIIQAAVPKERQTSSILGTPRFTAPEALIPGNEVDARADIFSVGVMLYQMLTGEVPRGAAPPPSEAAPGLDPRFDAIIAKAMAEQPADRYADASKLREALEELHAVPDPSALPAATMTLEKTSPPAPRAQVPVQAPAPEPDEVELPDYEELVARPPKQSGSWAPWISILLVVAVAWVWVWQQRKNPGSSELTRAPVAEAPASAAAAPSAQRPVAPPSAVAGGAPSPFEAPAPASKNPAAGTTPTPDARAASSAPVPFPTVEAKPGMSPEQLAETQRRVTQIKGDFEAAVKEWQAGQNAKFDVLDAQYLRAVRNGIVAMRNERRHDDLAGLQAEEQLLASRTPLPPLEAAAPPERVRLRGIYDDQVQSIARSGAETKVEIYNRLLGSLFAYQAILKQTNKREAAEMVGRMIAEAIKERDALRKFASPAENGAPQSVAAPVSDAAFGFVFEAEQLSVKATGGSAEPVRGTAAGLTGGQQLVWRGAKLGDTLTLPFEVSAPGRFRLEVALVKAQANGVFKFQLNGDFVGEPVYDLYTPGAEEISWQTLYSGPVKGGRNELLARVMDTNRTGPRGYDFALDCIRLSPLD